MISEFKSALFMYFKDQSPMCSDDSHPKHHLNEELNIPFCQKQHSDVHRCPCLAQETAVKKRYYHNKTAKE
jgi:hypothetical protein